MKKTLFALAAVAGLALATTATAGPYGKRVASDTASGKNAVASVSGKANRPRRIYLQVRTEPEQRFRASWSMRCSRGVRVGSASGDFSARAPLTKRLMLPLRRPSGCQVIATGRLRGSGRIVVAIYNKKRR